MDRKGVKIASVLKSIHKSLHKNIGDRFNDCGLTVPQMMVIGALFENKSMS